MGQLDSVLQYLAFVAKSRPLSVLLDDAPAKIAACVGADVASLYLLENDGQELVMRGNVGFTPRARGRVRLRLGEGIVGAALAAREPFWTARAPEQANYRRFPWLEEDRFPALAVVPIISSPGPLGAIVVQRETAFTEPEVSLVAALTAPIAAAVRLARLLDDLREQAPQRQAARRVTLPGTPLVRGRALGTVVVPRRPRSGDGGEKDGKPASAQLEDALSQAGRRLTTWRAAAQRRNVTDAAALIDSCLLMLDDQRLRRVAEQAIAGGEGLIGALGAVARDANRVAAKSGDDFLIARARTLEQLCDALVAIAMPDATPALPAKPVLLVQRLTIYDLLVAARAQPVAVVMIEAEPEPHERALLDLLAVPAIGDVGHAFRWTSPDDVGLVDADSGLLLLNPSRADIAAFRAANRNVAGSAVPSDSGPGGDATPSPGDIEI